MGKLRALASAMVAALSLVNGTSRISVQMFVPADRLATPVGAPP